MIPRRIHAMAAAGLLVASGAGAAEPAQRIDVSKLPAQVMDDVVVPVPSEVFKVLDRLGAPNWHGLLRTEEVQPSGHRPQIALLLGTVIAEGFIAVEARDATVVKKIGRNVLRLSGAIGVRKHVVARTNSIIEAADQKDWDKVRVELDGALHDVRAAMVELNDGELANLVSLGGWLRGTEAVTSIVRRSYSAAQAELLHQPALLDHFERRLDAMDPTLSGNGLVGKIRKQLGELRPLVEMQGGTIPEASVSRIHTITAELVRAVGEEES